jgi:hypothetical protein
MVREKVWLRIQRHAYHSIDRLLGWVLDKVQEGEERKQKGPSGGEPCGRPAGKEEDWAERTEEAPSDSGTKKASEAEEDWWDAGEQVVAAVYVKGQKVTRQDVLYAIDEFQRKYPNPNDYEGWLYDDDTYEYILEYEDMPYPPKKILSDASGVPIDEFPDGTYTNNRLRKLGFEVIPKY